LKTSCLANQEISQPLCKAQMFQVCDEDELNDVLDKIIQNNMDLVKERGDHVVVPLMGIAMKEVRGKASGNMVNDLLRKKVSEL